MTWSRHSGRVRLCCPDGGWKVHAVGGWMRQGCEQCRGGILSGRGDTPVPVAVSRAAHAYPRHCPASGAWWEEGEREAHVIPEDEARQTFADHFRAGEGGA